VDERLTAAPEEVADDLGEANQVALRHRNLLIVEGDDRVAATAVHYYQAADVVKRAGGRADGNLVSAAAAAHGDRDIGRRALDLENVGGRARLDKDTAGEATVGRSVVVDSPGHAHRRLGDRIRGMQRTTGDRCIRNDDMV